MNCYIDTEPTTSPGLPRPGPCRHSSVDFSKPEKSEGSTYVDCVCLGCGHRWAQLKVSSAPFTQQMLPAERR